MTPLSPDRKMIAGTLGAFVAWALFSASTAWFHFDIGAYLQPFVTAAFGAFGVSPAPPAQTGLAILCGSAIGYLTPASDWDVLKRMTDRLIAIARVDPRVTAVSAAPPTTLIQPDATNIIVDPAKGAPAIVTASPLPRKP